MENINPNHPINELWPPYGVINHIAFLATSHSSKHPAMHSALISEKSANLGEPNCCSNVYGFIFQLNGAEQDYF